MDPHIIEDHQHYALGRAARHIGDAADAYRPVSPLEPLSVANRFLRLQAAFLPASGGVRRNADYDDAGWHGIFDASYTRPGDYLTTSNRTFFIAAQQQFLPILCILTNRIISIGRTPISTYAGVSSYSGSGSASTSPLATGWPASVRGIGGATAGLADLPTSQPALQVTVLLPSIPAIHIASGDMVYDDLGRTIVVSTAEHSELGWRMSCRLATA